MWRKTALWQCLYEHVLPSRVQPSLSRVRVLSPSTPGSPRELGFPTDGEYTSSGAGIQMNQ